MNNNLNKSMEANIEAGRNPLWANETLDPMEIDSESVSSSSFECNSDCECDCCMDPKDNTYSGSFVSGQESSDESYVDEEPPLYDEAYWDDLITQIPDRFDDLVDEWAHTEPNVTNGPMPGELDPGYQAYVANQRNVYNVWTDSWMTAAELHVFYQNHGIPARSNNKRDREETVAQYMGLPHPPSKKRKFE